MVPDAQLNVWVIGASGLIGSAVAAEVERQGWSLYSGPRVPWEDHEVSSTLADGFASFLRASPTSPWAIVWAAGKAVPSSNVRQCEAETVVLTQFLRTIEPEILKGVPRGVFLMISSAGGVYAKVRSSAVTELTTPAPDGPYGLAKLQQEKTVERFSEATGVLWASARVSNVYGPGQDLSKLQGLVTKICESSVTNTPMHVSVPLDTQRDFIFVEDCGRGAAEILRRAMLGEVAGPVLLASGRPVSLGGVVGVLRRLRPGRPPRVRFSADAAKPADGHFAFKSVRLDPSEYIRVSLAEGCAKTLESVTRGRR